MITLQETFDKVVDHLRQQKCKAQTEVGCVYRTPDGKKCAAGCLIPDDEYKASFESRTVGYTEGIGDTKHFVVLSGAGALLQYLGYDVAFVRELQNIHDTYDVINWEAAFCTLAVEYGLVYRPVV